MTAGLDVPDGVPAGREVPDGVAEPLAGDSARCEPDNVVPDADELNSALLAGTSLLNEAKIWLSSGCVHSTLAVSLGTCSLRGKFGSVKKAILSVGIERSDCPRLYRPVMTPSWLSNVRDLVAASRNR